MKSISKILFLSISAFLISCSSDDDSSSLNSSNVTNIAIDGNWRVTQMIDDGIDETNEFNGFVFDFLENGSVVATSTNVTYQGTWGVRNSSSSSSFSGTEFDLFFGLNNDFEDLDDDWDILSISSSKIELRDVSGGDGSIDLLTFEKL